MKVPILQSALQSWRLQRDVGVVGRIIAVIKECFRCMACTFSKILVLKGSLRSILHKGGPLHDSVLEMKAADVKLQIVPLNYPRLLIRIVIISVWDVIDLMLQRNPVTNPTIYYCEISAQVVAYPEVTSTKTGVPPLSRCIHMTYSTFRWRDIGLPAASVLHQLCEKFKRFGELLSVHHQGGSHRKQFSKSTRHKTSNLRSTCL